MDKMTVFKAQQWAFSFIKDHGKDPSVVDLLLQGQLNWSTTEMLMNYQTQLSAEQLERFYQCQIILPRLASAIFIRKS